jgi:hypothetical protein
MPTPKQPGQSSGGMFAKYTGEQINQIPEGYVQGMGAMGQAYASIGQSIGAAAQAIGGAYGQQKDADAKMAGQIAPYAEKTRQEVEQSIKNGTLIKNPDGTVAPNTAAGVTSGMVDSNKISFYNQSGGGDITKLSSTDLTKYTTAFQSAQEMAKMEADRSTTALNNKLTETKIAETESKTNERIQGMDMARTVMAGINSSSNSVAPNLGLGGSANPTVQGTVPPKQSPEVNTNGAFNQYVNQDTGTFGQPAPNKQPVRPSYLGFEETTKPVSVTKPGEVPAYAKFSGYTVPTQTSANPPSSSESIKAEMDKTVSDIADYNKQAAEAKDPKVKEMALGYSRAAQAKFVELQSKALSIKTANQAAQAPSTSPQTKPGYGVRIDGTQKGAGWQGEIPTADGGVMTEKSIGVQIGGKEVLIPAITANTTPAQKSYLASGANLIADAQAGKPIAKQIIDDAVAHATPLVQQGKSPFAPTPNAPSEVAKVINPAAAQTPVPLNQSVIPGANKQPITPIERVQALNVQRTNLLAARDKDIQETMVKADAFKKLSLVLASNPSQTTFAKLSFDHFNSLVEQKTKQYDSQLRGIDDQIKGVQAEESLTTQGLKNQKEEITLDIKKAAETRAVHEDLMKRAAEHPRISIFTSPYATLSDEDKVKYGIAPLDATTKADLEKAAQGYLKSQNFILGIQDTLNTRIRSGEDQAARYRILTSDLNNWAQAELQQIFGVATFRQGIVSGGNFSDQDRIFVEKAIAALNDPSILNNAEVYKAKVKALATFVQGMYVDQFTAAGYTYDRKGMEAMAADMRNKGMGAAAGLLQESMDTQERFTQTFGLKSTPGTKSGYSDRSQILEARKTLAEGITDWTGMEKSNPSNFKNK